MARKLMTTTKCLSITQHLWLHIFQVRMAKVSQQTIPAAKTTTTTVNSHSPTATSMKKRFSMVTKRI